MNSFPVGETFALGLLAYAVGAVGSLVSWRKPALSRHLCCGSALAGAVLEGCAAILGLLQGTPVRWSISSGIPLFAFSFSYDALAGFFNLTLAILVAAVAIQKRAIEGPNADYHPDYAPACSTQQGDGIAQHG